MRIDERGIMVKALIYRSHKGEEGVTRKELESYICKTGLSPKSSSIQKVITYMLKNRHMRMGEALYNKSIDLYYIAYRNKNQANPKGIPDLSNQEKADINFKLGYAFFGAQEGMAYLNLVKILTTEIPTVMYNLNQKKECTIKFVI